MFVDSLSIWVQCFPILCWFSQDFCVECRWLPFAYLVCCGQVSWTANLLFARIISPDIPTVLIHVFFEHSMCCTNILYATFAACDMVDHISCVAGVGYGASMFSACNCASHSLVLFWFKTEFAPPWWFACGCCFSVRIFGLVFILIFAFYSDKLVR